MESTVAPVQTQPQMPPPITSPVLASRGTRLLAVIVDLAAFLVVYLVSFFINMPTLLFVGGVALAAYEIYLLSTAGQTIGKKVMSIKIVKQDTNENGGFVPNVLMRGVLNILLSFIPFYQPIDVLFIFRQDQCCIHDMIAGTKVIEA
jgi:uncharacterized RDD family membrane protein YckC